MKIKTKSYERDPIAFKTPRGVLILGDSYKKDVFLGPKGPEAVTITRWEAHEKYEPLFKGDKIIIKF